MITNTESENGQTHLPSFSDSYVSMELVNLKDVDHVSNEVLPLLRWCGLRTQNYQMDSLAIDESTRLFPQSRQETPICVPLSILDCTSARFSSTGCIWIFDHHDATPDHHTLVERLRDSFVATLNEFPQWSGQLQWTPFNPSGGYRERFNRIQLVYGSVDDPGVDWRTTSYSSESTAQFAPTPSERVSKKIWRGDNNSEYSRLVSDCPLALSDLKSYEGLPGMSVQVSLFGDGGYAIGVKLAHVLGDAQSLMVFVHMWAANSRGLHGYTGSPSLFHSPIFDPEQLDSHASGDINGSGIDHNLAAVARSLPLHRYDCWEVDAPGFPSFLAETVQKTMPPSTFLDNLKLSPTHSGPWSSWDPSRPVSYAHIHFSGKTLAKMQSSAQHEKSGASMLSRLDMLLAHLWSSINRARRMEQSSSDVFLNLTLGARARVSPPLPDSYIGSPLFLTHVKRSGLETCSESAGSLARSIRNTISLFTPEKVGAMLHDAAHEVSPLRLWQGFVGQRHVIVTSWLRLHVYQVDFEGTPTPPRYVHAIMPNIDGVLQVFDSATDDGGMDVALYLEAEAMDNLLRDNIFQAWNN
ncbi:transferase family protein [Talaromyces stipitatus ATCC 10500]|uniref:Transferase family protein n=1 Tax=Talaromyces stipitatus (strain ATCC 10500 / CBS 375.48 / QM 6759 / NRRL 1006) TaxID=441959 RepID=B8MSY7_TALSN|nr:transferase family protein [Talaromyces stipitatus ATCC 10500]EED12143.1 transferase family protein [Talaromyces stipitatus ATCC 10500]